MITRKGKRPGMIAATEKKQAPAPPAPAPEATESPALAAFVADGGHLMQNLRSSLARLIEAIPSPEPVRRAADLQRALNLRKTLAWQMFSVAHSPDPLTE